MSEDEIKQILTTYKVVAIVGMSDTLGKHSYRVGAYLKRHGYQIIPVNPTIDKVLGCKSYRTLLEIPERIQKTIEVINIFRKPEDVPPIIEQAIKLKARFGKLCVVWMQVGIVNQQAAQTALQAGLAVVMDKCIMAEHHRLIKHGDN
jgi:predicted CoA-binding protein